MKTSLTIFDIIKDIQFNKTGKLEISDQSFSEYILQRYLTMQNDSNTILLNETYNKIYKGIKSKEDLYKFLLSITPKIEFYRINYIKRPFKEANKEEDEKLQEIAKHNKTSVKNIKEYIELGLEL